MTAPVSATTRRRTRPSSAATAVELSLAEGACLTLVAQRVSHGWAIGTALAADGEIGRVWSLSRPLTYRAIDALADRGLLTRRESPKQGTRARATLTATAAGRRASERWLDEPACHLRDVRTELLVKLVLRTRAGIDNRPLLQAQLDVFAPSIHALTTAGGGDVVEQWRAEHARAVRRFLEGALRDEPVVAAVTPELRLSARNQLRARVVSVQRGELMAGVKAVLGDGQQLTATITQEASDDLDLAPGDAVTLIVKANEVMVAKPVG